MSGAFASSVIVVAFVVAVVIGVALGNTISDYLEQD